MVSDCLTTIFSVLWVDAGLLGSQATGLRPDFLWFPLISSSTLNELTLFTLWTQIWARDFTITSCFYAVLFSILNITSSLVHLKLWLHFLMTNLLLIRHTSKGFVFFLWFLVLNSLCDTYSTCQCLFFPFFLVVGDKLFTCALGLGWWTTVLTLVLTLSVFPTAADEWFSPWCLIPAEATVFPSWSTVPC